MALAGQGKLQGKHLSVILRCIYRLLIAYSHMNFVELREKLTNLALPMA